MTAQKSNRETFLWIEKPRFCNGALCLVRRLLHAQTWLSSARAAVVALPPAQLGPLQLLPASATAVVPSAVFPWCHCNDSVSIWVWL